MTLCKGITFSDYLLHAHTSYNFGRTHRHKCKRLVPLGGCACILRDELTKIYTWSHTLSFIHVHILKRPKAIHVYGYKSIEEPVKANINYPADILRVFEIKDLVLNLVLKYIC